MTQKEYRQILKDAKKELNQWMKDKKKMRVENKKLMAKIRKATRT